MVPQKGMTVEAWDRKMRPDNYFAKFKASHKIYAESESTLEGITSAKALRELKKQMEKRLTPKDIKRRLAAGREQAELMLESLGEVRREPGDDSDYESVQDKIDSLDDFQFNVLWSELDLADLISSMYSIMKLTSESREHAGIYTDAMRDIGELISWAKTLQEPSDGR
jgi:hypothetical protein